MGYTYLPVWIRVTYSIESAGKSASRLQGRHHLTGTGDSYLPLEPLFNVQFPQFPTDRQRNPVSRAKIIAVKSRLQFVNPAPNFGQCRIPKYPSRPWAQESRRNSVWKEGVYNVPVYPDKIKTSSPLAEKRVYANKVSLLGRFACSYTKVLVLERLCMFQYSKTNRTVKLNRRDEVIFSCQN